MLMLDTNICIYIINLKPPHVIEKFKQYTLGEIVISSITANEFSFSVEKNGSTKNKLALQKFFAPLDILSFDEQCIWHYAMLGNEL